MPIAHARISLAAGTGGNVPLQLPNIERHIIVTEMLQLVLSLAPIGADISMFMSHNRSAAVLTTVLGERAEDPTNWYIQTFDAVGSTVTVNLRELHIELGGEQNVLCWNGSSVTLEFVVHLWYNIRQGSLTEWSRIAQETSFEE